MEIIYTTVKPEEGSVYHYPVPEWQHKNMSPMELAWFVAPECERPAVVTFSTQDYHYEISVGETSTWVDRMDPVIK